MQAKAEQHSAIDGRSEGLSALSFAARIAGVSLLSAVLSSCSSDSMPPSVILSQDALSSLPVPRSETLIKLDGIYRQLEAFDQKRAEAMTLYWPVVQLHGELREMYTQGTRKHRELTEQCIQYQCLLASGGYVSDVQFEQCRVWAEQTERDLHEIGTLVDYVERHNGRWLGGWAAPTGYEFIRPIGR